MQAPWSYIFKEQPEAVTKMSPQAIIFKFLGWRLLALTSNSLNTSTINHNYLKSNMSATCFSAATWRPMNIPSTYLASSLSFMRDMTSSSWFLFVYIGKVPFQVLHILKASFQEKIVMSSRSLLSRKNRKPSKCVVCFVNSQYDLG